MTRFYSTIVLHSLFIVCLKKYTTSTVHHNNGSVVNEQDAFSSTSPYTSYTLAEAISQLRACECLLSIRLVCCAGVCCLHSSCCEYTTFCAILGLQRSITAGDNLLYTRTALLLRFSSPVITPQVNGGIVVYFLFVSCSIVGVYAHFLLEFYSFCKISG